MLPIRACNLTDENRSQNPRFSKQAFARFRRWQHVIIDNCMLPAGRNEFLQSKSKLFSCINSFLPKNFANSLRSNSAKVLRLKLRKVCRKLELAPTVFTVRCKPNEDSDKEI